MREIKFRAWNESYKYMTANVTLQQISEGFTGMLGNIPMQFTGLRDKNGKEIYEGDIIQYTYLPGKTFWNFDGKGVVKWESTGFFMDTLPGKGGVASWFTSLPGMFMPACQELVEVIGNIYENPELLEAQ